MLAMAEPDLDAAYAAWRAWLAHEKRAAARTQAGYAQDLQAFVSFMAGHQGGPVGLETLRALAPQGFRGWLAWRLRDGYAKSSTQRAVAALRGFSTSSTRATGCTTRHSGRCGHRAPAAACHGRWRWTRWRA
jgi:integrase/recombinase XerC